MRPHELRAARKALGLTQTALGRALGMGPLHPRRMIHEYEAGRYAITGPVAAAVRLMLEAKGLTP